MPKRSAKRKLPVIELKNPVAKMNIKFPLKVKPKNIDWKRFKLKTNQVLVALLIVAAFLIGVLFTKVQYLEKGQTGNNQQAAAPAGQQGNQAVTPAPGAKVNVGIGHFPIKGDKNAKVTLIEFADFRCPFCEQFFSQTEPQIIKDYVDTGKVKFAFRDLAILGPASITAGDAAECANDQGKFWDYYNYLYKNQPDESDTSMYNTDTLTQAAVSLGMNGDTFRSCLDGKKDESKVNQDISDGEAAGVSGTPSFFVNGTLIVGAQPYDVFKQLIDQELAKAK